MSTKTAMFENVTLAENGELRGTHFDYSSPTNFIGDLRMMTIRTAYYQCGANAAEAVYGASDGYGEAGFIPSQGMDWSGIRDSSEEAKAQMFAIAQSFFSLNGMAAILGLDAQHVADVAAKNYSVHS